jgi:hypothetical protein
MRYTKTDTIRLYLFQYNDVLRSEQNAGGRNATSTTRNPIDSAPGGPGRPYPWSPGHRVLGIAGGACAADVVVPGTTDFPESVTASSDGTLFFSSLAGGRIFKAAPGETQAKEWIKPGTNGLSSAVGVLADDRSNTLFVCSTDMTWADIHVPAGNTPTAVKMFDLKTGAPKGSLALPASTLPGQSALCNDIAVAADVDVARGQQSKSLELRAATSLARLWETQGKRAEARDLLDPIHGWFTEGLDTPDLQDAKALLGQLV